MNTSLRTSAKSISNLSLVIDEKQTVFASQALHGRRDASGVTYDSAAELLRFGDCSDDPRIAAARMTLGRGSVHDDAREAMKVIRGEMSAATARKLADYVPALPAGDIQKIRTFVEDAVVLALPQTQYSVETLLRPCMRFVYWAVFVVGCPLDATVVFDRELIEEYIRSAAPRRDDGSPLTDGTLRNYRAWIFRVAEAVNPEKNPRRALPLNARSMDEPYNAEELVALGRWAAGQGTPYMRQAANTLIALGAGAGLSSGEIALLRAESITVSENGLVTIEVVDGDRVRHVVVVAKYEKRLAKAVRKIPAGAFLFLPKRTRADNDIVSAFVARSSTPPGSPTIRVRRLRNTWLVRQLTNRVDVFTLMEAAGLQSLESISRLAIFVPRPSDDDRTAQLRGKK
jgi:integrase